MNIRAQIALEASCLKEIHAVETWDPVPLLRGIAHEVTIGDKFDGDYKDAIASLSAKLADKIWEYEARSGSLAERRTYVRIRAEASRRGLFNGYDCPRATREAWDALVRGD